MGKILIDYLFSCCFSLRNEYDKCCYLRTIFENLHAKTLYLLSALKGYENMFSFSKYAIGSRNTISED